MYATLSATLIFQQQPVQQLIQTLHQQIGQTSVVLFLFHKGTLFSPEIVIKGSGGHLIASENTNLERDS